MFFIRYLVIALFLIGLSSAAHASEWVNGYLKRDGNYVQGYYRSKADGYQFNNYSAYGNVNPYTGKVGTRRSDSWGSSYGSYKSYNRAYSPRSWRQRY